METHRLVFAGDLNHRVFSTSVTFVGVGSDGRKLPLTARAETH